ncbi:GntP family permease [Moraxella bovis]|uniref:GntP family permease n=2 Tax=Moraxella bovis TaxID=476 RepID=A0AAQ2QCA1_MORBO|nr:GntP family permease [Moraxella bovis]AWY19768.1 GntP family permease [Moraxella bovis]UYZ77015.1 GntP family permease [Moraxella bovis]UYZ79642.1 GntP family permease [Moraxella bovis]UYZ82488.1 GntP family permease [Moraxella bovis]UYZ88127.1 GntP family permease [Moraxella bovis]
MMSILAIIISLVLLMYFAYRGWSVLILAPIMAALAVILSGDGTLLLPAYTETFMKALGGYLLKFFPVFLLGALFGQLMADSGAATTIANTITEKLGASRAILVVVLVCGILTYGGVSLFVVAFSIYPISKALFRQADIPKRLIPASIALGSFTFTMTALPGTPAIQNAIPIPYYQTNAFAAPILGLIGACIMFVLGTWWLQSRANLAKKTGEGYGNHIDDDTKLLSSNMSFVLAAIPLILVITINALLTYGVFPNMDFGAITTKFPELEIKANLGLWSIIIALLTSCSVLILLNLRHFKKLQESVNKGVYGSMLPIFNTASEVGYGAVIATMAGFAIIRDNILNISPNNPLVSEAVAMSVLAGITGSSSGGLSIALQTLGEDYLRLAIEHNIDPELLHRVAVMAAGGLDTLPHSGAVITLFAICHLTHKQSYVNLAVVTIAIPILATICVIMLGTFFGSF